jgi:hypothetical protein
MSFERNRIQHTLDGAYWQQQQQHQQQQTAAERKRTNVDWYRAGRRTSPPLPRPTPPQTIRAHPYRHQDDDNNASSNAEILRQLEQQRAAWESYFPPQRTSGGGGGGGGVPTAGDDDQRPVTMGTFTRFLNHFEQNIAELRQSLDNIAAKEVKSTAKAVGAMAAVALPATTTSVAQSLLCCENQQCWRWRAKTLNDAKELPPPSETLHAAIETAYQQYMLRGNVDRSCKNFEQDNLYINFDSRRGTFQRQPVAFERSKL